MPYSALPMTRGGASDRALRRPHGVGCGGAPFKFSRRRRGRCFSLFATYQVRSIFGNLKVKA